MIFSCGFSYALTSEGSLSDGETQEYESPLTLVVVVATDADVWASTTRPTTGHLPWHSTQNTNQLGTILVRSSAKLRQNRTENDNTAVNTGLNFIFKLLKLNRSGRKVGPSRQVLVILPGPQDLKTGAGSSIQ